MIYRSARSVRDDQVNRYLIRDQSNLLTYSIITVMTHGRLEWQI